MAEKIWCVTISKLDGSDFRDWDFHTYDEGYDFFREACEDLNVPFPNILTKNANIELASKGSGYCIELLFN
jgi:hypothetical protein